MKLRIASGTVSIGHGYIGVDIIFSFFPKSTYTIYNVYCYEQKSILTQFIE
jgi:hypothetical protein